MPLASGLKLYTSNHLECLAEQLAAAIAPPLGSVFASEIVIVQSRGMARWTALQIAEHSGICMNCEFPFPKAFVEETLRQFFPEMAPEDEYSVGVMAWRIFALLPALATRPAFQLVKGYLAHDDGLKTFQLAQKVAHLFDQYLVYRPDMLMRWQREQQEQEWQAILWRALVKEGGPWHLAAIAELLGSRTKVLPPRSRLPERVSLFGLSSIPPLYLRVFFELARHCEVHLLLLQPSREYYGHDLPPKVRARILSQMEGRGLSLSGEGLPIGNPLLASLGKLNRDLLEVRIDLDEEAGFLAQEQPDRFIEADEGTLLGMVQNDLLHASNRDGAELPRIRVRPIDDSIQLHRCHSPMREVEVLYDQLLAMFEADPGLRPRDILVMTPEIEKYAPLIQAIFAYPEDRRRFIPYSIADRRPASTSSVIETFFALLELPGSRCAASEIFSLLERSPLRRCFAFSDDDLATIRRWIADTGIRWGIDGRHRSSFQLPELEGNTWRAGLRRLLLGYAMAGGDRQSFEGMIPHDEVEGSTAEILGRLLSVTDALFDLATGFTRPRSLHRWADALSELIEQFFGSETSEELADLAMIRSALHSLRHFSVLARADQDVELRVVRYHLSQTLDQGERRGGFLTGGVTFCALQPMRSIPSKVICLLGMGDQAFPRPSHPPGFDLMLRDRRCGDRTSRDDDRYVFLETLIAARQRLYLSYVGRSVLDNEISSPSVLVGELLDYLDQACAFPAEAAARDFLSRQHRLHAFSAHYFSEGTSRLFSYSEANAAAARIILVGSATPRAGLLPAAGLEPGEEFRTVELNRLVQFFAGPARYFLRERAGIRLEEQDCTLEDSEPFSLGPLERYHLSQDLVARILDDDNTDASDFVGRGVLPLGEIGGSLFHALREEAELFRETVEPELAGASLAEPWPLDLQIGPFLLTGRIESIFGSRLVHYRCSSLKPKDWLRAWIHHLAKCATRPEAAAESVLLGHGGGVAKVRFSPVPNAQEALRTLLNFYWQGLSRPLPFFPAAGLGYARATLSTSTRSKPPLEQARAIWNGSPRSRGEKSERYHEYYFKESDPLSEEFVALTTAIFGPILKNASTS